MTSTVYSVVYLPEKTVGDLAGDFGLINQEILKRSHPSFGKSGSVEMVLLPLTSNLTEAAAVAAMDKEDARLATIEQVMTLISQRSIGDGYYLALGTDMGLNSTSYVYVCGSSRDVCLTHSWNPRAQMGCILVGVKR